VASNPWVGIRIVQPAHVFVLALPESPPFNYQPQLGPGVKPLLKGFASESGHQLTDHAPPMSSGIPTPNEIFGSAPMDAELGKVKEAAEQANARFTELESAGANTAKEAEAERSKLQTALDAANTEIERLRTELEQQKASPPEQGDLVSPPHGE